MPVGAIVGSAVVGAGASVYSGSKAAKAQTKAAQQGADVQQYMYDQSREDQAPWRNVGQGALYKLADMYGVPYTKTTGVNWDQYVLNNPDALAGWNSMGSKQQAQYGSMQQFGKYHYEQDGSRRDLSPYMAGGQGGSVGDYGGFMESPGYQWRRDEAMKAVQRMGAARGARFSPQTWKASERYADNLASSEFENYGNALRSMAGIGQTSAAQTAQLGLATGQGIAQQYTNAGNARASSYANTGAAISGLGQNLAYGALSGMFGGGGGGGEIPSYYSSGPLTVPTQIIGAVA